MGQTLLSVVPYFLGKIESDLFWSIWSVPIWFPILFLISIPIPKIGIGNDIGTDQRWQHIDQETLRKIGNDVVIYIVSDLNLDYEKFRIGNENRKRPYAPKQVVLNPDTDSLF